MVSRNEKCIRSNFFQDNHKFISLKTICDGAGYFLGFSMQSPVRKVISLQCLFFHFKRHVGLFRLFMRGFQIRSTLIKINSGGLLIYVKLASYRSKRLVSAISQRHK